MQLEAAKLLVDIDDAGKAIQSYLQHKVKSDFLQDRMLRSAVEREFIVIGEAMSQLRQRAGNTARRITHADKIVAFRHRLVHGYSMVVDDVVWDIIQVDLPALLHEVAELLKEQQSA
ncbi:MAG: DUF86 domain-containing protein [Phycisphaerales bacterium]|nr:DUF86 domain-containing protein [Phycisphaerales bacterium]